MVKPNGRTLTSVTIGQLFRASVSFFISLIIIGVFCVPILANDPPHNDDSGVPCGECHAEELFAGDPGLLTPAELRELYNTVCLRCHWETSGTYHANAGTPVPGWMLILLQLYRVTIPLQPLASTAIIPITRPNNSGTAGNIMVQNGGWQEVQAC
jgi:hypothetical protein